jgi:hypothetical protein
MGCCVRKIDGCSIALGLHSHQVSSSLKASSVVGTALLIDFPCNHPSIETLPNEKVTVAWAG